MVCEVGDTDNFVRGLALDGGIIDYTNGAAFPAHSRPFFEVPPPRHLAERGRQRRPSGRGPYPLREAQQHLEVLEHGW